MTLSTPSQIEGFELFEVLDSFKVSGEVHQKLFKDGSLFGILVFQEGLADDGLDPFSVSFLQSLVEGSFSFWGKGGSFDPLLEVKAIKDKGNLGDDG